MRIEFIDDTTAVIVTDDLENLLRATQTLVNHEIDACSITTVNGMPFLSLRKGGQDMTIAILIDKVAASTPQEFFGMKKKDELEEFPLDEKEEEFPLDEPVAVEKPTIEKKRRASGSCSNN